MFKTSYFNNYLYIFDSQKICNSFQSNLLTIALKSIFDF